MTWVGGLIVTMAALAITTVVTGEWRWWGRALANALTRLAVLAVPLRERPVRRGEWCQELEELRRDLQIPGVLQSVQHVIAGSTLRIVHTLALLARARSSTVRTQLSMAFAVAFIIGGNVVASWAPAPSWRETAARALVAACFSILTVPALVEHRLHRAVWAGEPSYVVTGVSSLIFGSNRMWASATTIATGVGLAMLVGAARASEVPGALGMALASISWTASWACVVGVAACSMFIVRARRPWPTPQAQSAPARPYARQPHPRPRKPGGRDQRTARRQ